MVDVISASSPDYEDYRHVYTARGNPALVFVPRSADEVASALDSAVAGRRAVAVRSGGHGISSISTNDGGVVIDLRRLDAVERVSDGLVRIGPGARWSRVAKAMRPWGLALTSGDSGDVGVGGLATTGGIGLMGRAHGLTIDRLKSVDIITADGGLRTIDAQQEPELFWAVRGAGANFGIVTSFLFEPSPTPDVVQASLFFDVTNPASFLRVWGRLVEEAPREISAFLYVTSGPLVQAQATIVFAGDDESAARDAMRGFVALPGLVSETVAAIPYASVPISTGDPHTGQQGASAHSGLVDHIDETTGRALAAHLASDGVDLVMLRSVGGAINDVAEDATAYAHRHQNFSVMSVSMTGGEPFDAAWDPVYRLMDGLYLSFETSHEPKHLRDAFPGATLDRLRSAKLRWDPDGIFDQNFSLVP